MSLILEKESVIVSKAESSSLPQETKLHHTSNSYRQQIPKQGGIPEM